jgi:hypothetical protein
MVTIDLGSGSVASVDVDNEILLEAWAGACAEENGGHVVRGATRDEVERALGIAAASPWPATTLAASMNGRRLFPQG